MDTYGTLPFSLFKDERLDGASLVERLFAAVIKSLSNDINLVEGDSVGFAQLIGADPADVAPLMDALEQREFIERFTAPNRRRQVAEVLGHFAGECDRKAKPSQRTKSHLPNRDGTFFEGARKERGNPKEAAPNSPTSRQPSANQSGGETPAKTSAKPSKSKKAPESRDVTESPTRQPSANGSPTSRQPSAVRPSENDASEHDHDSSALASDSTFEGADDRSTQGRQPDANQTPPFRQHRREEKRSLPSEERSLRFAQREPDDEQGRSDPDASSPSPLKGEASSVTTDLLGEATRLLRDFDWPLDNEAPLDDEVRKALRVVAQDREIDPEELRWELWKGRYWPTEQATDEAWHTLAYGTSSWLTVPEIVQVWVEQMQRVSPDPRLPAPPSYLHIGEGPKPGILILAEDLRLVLQRLLAGGYERGASTSTSFMRWRETKRRAGCGWHDADRAVTAMMRRALDGETVAPPPSHEEVFLRRWATLDADARWMVARQELAKTREKGRAVLNFAHLDVVKAALLTGGSVEGASVH